MDSTGRIKNEHYKQFMRGGLYTRITDFMYRKALKNVKGRYEIAGRGLLTVLYYTGCRPVEALDIITDNFTLQTKGSIGIMVPGSKRGRPRTIILNLSEPAVKELWQYVRKLPPKYRLFHMYRGEYVRKYVNKHGKEITYIQTTDKFRYHFYKWFDGVIDGSIPPYYLRHNRMSKLAEAGLSMPQLQVFKGSKTYESITPYLHHSTAEAKKIVRLLKDGT